MLNRFVSPALALMATLGFLAQAQAQTPVQRYEEYSKRLKEQEKIAPLKADVFGDQVSLYNGSTEFVVTDIDIPGNNALPVQLQRRLKIETKKDQENFGGIGVWDIEVPYMVGTFSANTEWNTGGAAGDRTRRCSDVWYPYTPQGFNQGDFWSGTMIHIPGQGERELLTFDQGAVPQDGFTWPWTARDNLRLRCKAQTANGFPGEAFIAVDAQGTKYTFDYGTKRYDSTVSNGQNTSARTKVFLLATRVEDRYGNWVTYTYEDQPGVIAPRGMLKRIQSSDGRRIDLTFLGAQLKTATAHGRTWTYDYDYNYGGTPGAVFGGGPTGQWLKKVTLPDNSYWEYVPGSGQRLIPIYPTPDIWADGTCQPPEFPAGITFDLTVRHPAGARGVFAFDYTRHRRSGTPNTCQRDPLHDLWQEPTFSLLTPDYYDMYSLVKKTVVTELRDPVLPLKSTDYKWEYFYELIGQHRANPPYPCANCPDRKTTIVKAPDNSTQEHVFGVRYWDNDGRLLSVTTKSPAGAQLSKVTNTYWAETDPRPFPDLIGVNGGNDDIANLRVRPITGVRTEQQGVSFVTSSMDFDEFARPTRQFKINSTSLNGSRTEITAFRDNKQRWVLGQTQSLQISGISQPVYSVLYDSATDNPQELTRFGQFEQRYTYDMSTAGALGSLVTISDARNGTTSLLDYHRGIPRTLNLPTGASESATISDWGNITSHTDANQDVTEYSYDSLGRLAGVTYPEKDVRAWNPTQIEFVPVQSIEYGLGAGHWRRTVSNGARRDVTYFDGLWRPVQSRQYDGSNASFTNRFITRRFDHENREVFASYPTSKGGSVSRSGGVYSEFDALGRITKYTVDSELGQLDTTTTYAANFQKIVTNPRGLATTYSFQTFGEPDENSPTLIQQPGGITTTITRDKMGKPTLIQRSGSFEGSPVSALRTYVYDSAERLCKRIEPESGATIFGYDLVGNIEWSTVGSPLTSATCDRASVPGNQRTTRGYDYMNRPLNVIYPDNVQNLFMSYYPDGKMHTATAGEVTTTYDYAKRGMLLSETIVDGTLRYKLGYDYNDNGDAAGLSYPDGKNTQFQPNVLGEPTSAGGYAYGATYSAAGLLTGYTYGNQISYVASANGRQLLGNFTYGLPSGQLLLSHDLKYDRNANLDQIVDLVPGAQRSRTMTYDDADRLTGVQATAAMGGPEAFTYDPLDNLRRVTRGGLQLVYNYGATNRLDTVKNGSITVVGYSYDDRGNAIARNSAALAFDRADRVSSVGSTSYLYDAQGRRHQRNQGGQKTNFIYSNAGQFLFEHDTGTNKITRHHYLGSRLVARVEDTPPLPVAPVLSVPPTSSNGLYTVTWNAVPGAVYYRLEEKANSGIWVDLGEITATSWAPSPAKANGTYYYRARACQFVCSGYSAEVNVVVGSVLPAPVLTAPALGANGNYSVSWTAVSGATSYMLEEFSAGAWTPIYSGLALGLPFSQKPAGTYRYQVKACTSTCGAYSNQGETVVLYAPTEAPVLTLPAQSSGSYVLSWTAVARASGYVVEQETNASNTWVVIAPAAGQVEDALLRNFSGQAVATYRYRVKAANAAGSGPVSLIHSHTVSALVPVLTVPATNTTGSYSVSWTSVPGATRYALQEKKGTGSYVTVQSDGSTSSSRTRKGTGRYTYQVRACTGAADTTCGAYSAEKFVDVTIAPPPVPANLTAVAQGAGCLISWSASSGAEDYELRAGGSVQYSGPETSFYYDAQCMGGYQVRAGFLGSWSSWSGQTGVPPTSAPTLSAPATNSTGAYDVTWTAVSGAEEYKLVESFNQGAWVQRALTDLRLAQFTGKANGSYRYKVSACLENGACGPESAIATVVVNLVPVPAAPTLSAPATSTGSFTVSWTSPTHAAWYELKKSVSGGAWTDELPTHSTATSNSYSSVPTANYSFRVYACNVSGCSPGSNIVTVVVNSNTGSPSVPTNVQVQSIGGGSCKVSWNASTGTVTKYFVIDNFGTETDAGVATSYTFDTPCASAYQVMACNGGNCSAPSQPVGP